MHKKLLLVMLVPILALSLIVVGCGGDDDAGLFDGDPTFRGIQGSWVSVWTENPDQWFLVNANQIQMMNPATTEGGLAFRTGFSILSHGDITDVVPAHEVRTINQQDFLQAINAHIAPWLTNENPGWWEGNMPAGMTWVGGADGFEFGGGTVVPSLLDSMESFVDDLGAGVLWGSINLLNSLMIEHVGARNLENFFRNMLGIDFAFRFRNDNLMEALAYPNNAPSREAIGFTPADLGSIAPDAPIFVDPGTIDPRRVVTFSWSLYHWETSEDAGTLHAMWIDPTGIPSEQVLIIFSSIGPYFWQDNLPIPIGVFTRQ